MFLRYFQLYHNHSFQMISHSYSFKGYMLCTIFPPHGREREPFAPEHVEVMNDGIFIHSSFPYGVCMSSAAQLCIRREGPCWTALQENDALSLSIYG